MAENTQVVSSASSRQTIAHVRSRIPDFFFFFSRSIALDHQHIVAVQRAREALRRVSIVILVIGVILQPLSASRSIASSELPLQMTATHGYACATYMASDATSCISLSVRLSMRCFADFAYGNGGAPCVAQDLDLSANG